MAKPNYSYEKRQRELEKKKKKEDKAMKKASGHSDTPNNDPAAGQDSPGEAPAAPAGDTPAA